MEFRATIIKKLRPNLRRYYKAYLIFLKNLTTHVIHLSSGFGLGTCKCKPPSSKGLCDTFRLPRKRVGQKYHISYFCLHILPYYIHIWGITPYLVGAPLSLEPSKDWCNSFEGWMTSQTFWTSTVQWVVSFYQVKFMIQIFCEQAFTICFVCFKLLNVLTLEIPQNIT